jgi:hypothetical protein
MIFHPYKGQQVRINYKDKTMEFQDGYGRVEAVATGKGPKNVLVGFLSVTLNPFYEIIPRGNLNAKNNQRSRIRFLG